MIALTGLGALYFLVTWWVWAHVLPEYRKIAACRHTKGKLIKAIPDITGRPTALVWICRDCPFQVPLTLSRRGKYWSLGADDERGD